MSIEMEWSPDFCLACDRQSSGGAYCSQACRLADIEKASGSSEPVSPSSWSSPVFEHGTGFVLPPPLDFDAYRSARRASRLSAGRQSSSSSSPESPHDSYFPLMPAARPSLSSISGLDKLTPSSSRTSLSSVGRPSTPDNGALSDKARNELRSYANCFDQVRDCRRRIISP
ncbi:hypothetical protein L228DRAFT_266022 [Xylona heveae TC161]|uniref:Uncharacterized protein n=1 Tax=Xylona heveae (strain CBS 132557 / TC161) TaxID=1328760 RepID=A0A165IYK5_XYLHT|nr:hypothetical protein L228DRAFT_266022 [Xylona heveae TC161]KZF25555.1 hypothetical protein L228DRAFT_266022 [Xylona heveae TC161]